MISVIIPVFNGAAFLRETLESILEQSFEDWEIWLVDDGSTDDTGKIMEEYTALDDRIHCLHQRNQGVGAARNRGLEKAEGEWVWFVDGDDLLPKDALKCMHETAIHTGADLVIGNFCYYFEKTRRLSEPGQSLNGARVLKGTDRIPCIHMHPMILNKMWRRDRIEQYRLRFQAFRNIEDFDFYFQFLVYSHCVAVTDQVVCYYRLHDASASHSYSDSILDTIEVFAHMKEFCRNHAEAEPFRGELVFDEIFHYCMMFRRLPGYVKKEDRKKILDAYIAAERAIDYSAAEGSQRAAYYARKFRNKKRLRRLYESDAYCAAYRFIKQLRDEWNEKRRKG